MESPAFLKMKNEYGKLYEVLNFISIKNEKQEDFKKYIKNSNFNNFNENCIPKLNQINDFQNNNSSQKVNGIPYCLKINGKKLILLGMTWFIMSFVYYGVCFNILKFKGNIYVNGFLIYSSETISMYLSNIFTKYSTCRNTIIKFLIMSGFSFFLLSIFNSSNFFYVVLLFLAKFGISGVYNLNYIFTSTLFDTDTRVGSLCFCSLMLRIGGITVSLAVELIDNLSILFALMIFLDIIIFFKIKENKN